MLIKHVVSIFFLVVTAMLHMLVEVMVAAVLTL